LPRALPSPPCFTSHGDRPAIQRGARLRFVGSRFGSRALSFVVGMHEPGADRHGYVLLAGVAVATAAFAVRGRPAIQTGAAAALLVTCALLAFGANRRIGVWRSDLTLWRAALATSSSSARVHHNLAAALAEDGRWGAARRHLTRASALDPSYWPSALGFAGIDCARGRFRGRRGPCRRRTRSGRAG
jgi:hypothetical protein